MDWDSYLQWKMMDNLFELGATTFALIVVLLVSWALGGSKTKDTDKGG